MTDPNPVAMALLTLAASVQKQGMDAEEATAMLRDALGLAEERFVRLEAMAAELGASSEWLRELRERDQFKPFFHQMGYRGVVLVEAAALKEEIKRCPAIARRR